MQVLRLAALAQDDSVCGEHEKQMQAFDSVCRKERAKLRSELVTFLIFHDFLPHKSFVFSSGCCEKTKKSQALRMTEFLFWQTLDFGSQVTSSVGGEFAQLDGLAGAG